MSHCPTDVFFSLGQREFEMFNTDLRGLAVNLLWLVLRTLLAACVPTQNAFTL
jgi:hypothetical protein